MSEQDDNADGISQILKSTVQSNYSDSGKEFEQRTLEGISNVQNGSIISIHLKKENSKIPETLNVIEQINDLQALAKEEEETFTFQNKKKRDLPEKSPAKNKKCTPKKSLKTPTKINISFESTKKRHISGDSATEAMAIKRPKIQECVDVEKEEEPDEDGWQDVGDESDNMNVDEALEEKAVKIKMTAKNVKSVIHHVLTNEHVLNMFKTVLESEKGETSPQKTGTLKKVFTPEKLDCVPKMTRAKVKDFLEKIYAPSPAKSMKDGPSILDLEFAEEEDDDEYNPEKDEECHESDDDESISSSRLSEIGSPYAATPTTLVIRDLKHDSISTTPVHHDSSIIPNSGTPRNLVAEFTASAGPSEENRNEGDDNIALRTRSKLPLTSTSIIEIESKFVAPDITPDMYDVHCEDADWLQFLSSLYKTSDETITDDDGDANDPEFNYIAEAEREKLDKEDFRCDKPTKITKKELNILINELNGLFEDELLPYQVVAGAPEVNLQMSQQNRTEDDHHNLPSTSSTSFTDFKAPEAPPSHHHMTGTIGYDDNQCINDIQSSQSHVLQEHMQYEEQDSVASCALLEESGNSMFTSAQLAITQDNMRKHIQLLAQSFLLFHNTAGKLSNLPKNMIMELANFRDNSPALLSSVYNICNLDPALQLVNDDSIFENIGSSNVGAVSGRRGVDSMMTTAQKRIIYNSPVFIYPSLLPPFRTKPNETKKSNKFLNSEDNLIALGLEQFQHCRNVLPVQLIQDLLIRGKTTNQIYFRIQFKSSTKVGDNPIKAVKKTGKLPIDFPKPVVDQYYPMAPKDQCHNNLPLWCSKTQNCESSFGRHNLAVTIPAQSQHIQYVSPNFSSTKTHKTKRVIKKNSSTPAPVLPSDNRCQTLILPNTLAPVSSIFIQFAPSPGYTTSLQQLQPQAVPVLAYNVANSVGTDMMPNCGLTSSALSDVAPKSGVTIKTTTLSSLSQTSPSTQTDATSELSSIDHISAEAQVPSSPDMLAKSMIVCGIEASPICLSPLSPPHVCDITKDAEPCAVSTPANSLKHPIVRNLKSAFDAAHGSTVRLELNSIAPESKVIPITVSEVEVETDDKTEKFSSQFPGKGTGELSEKIRTDQTMNVSDDIRSSGSIGDVSEDTYRLYYSESDRDSTMVTDDDDVDLVQSRTKTFKVVISHGMPEQMDDSNNGRFVISSSNDLEKKQSLDNESTSISLNNVPSLTAANVDKNCVFESTSGQISKEKHDQIIGNTDHVSVISPDSKRKCSKRRLKKTCPSNSTDNSPKGVTVWEQSNSPVKTPALHLDTRGSPQRLRPLAPKPETPSKLISPGYTPLPKVSPRRKELNKQVRNLLPKSFIFEAKTPSPIKSAALLLKKKATLVCQQRSPVKILPKVPLPVVSPSKPRPRATLTPSRMFTRSQHVKTKNAAQNITQGELKKKDNLTGKHRPAESEMEEANLSQEDEEEDDEVFGDDDQMQLEDLMAACTTIGYEPKRGGNQETDTKSKSQKKKDLCLAMLEPDIIERDPKKDERDTAYAQYYFNRVKEVLKDDPERFRKFLTHLHDLNKDHCNPVELYADMAVLLSDHQDLVDDFGGFLLSFQAVECQCFVSSLEYQQIRSFLRQLEIYCDNSTFTYQRTLKMMSKWLSLNQDAQTDCTPFRDRISAVLRHVPGLMDDLLLYFFDAPLPDSHPDDFENVELDEFYDLSETDKFEEVTLPEGREDYNTKLCSCTCHADQQDEKLQKRSRHCVSCSLKMFDGRPVLKMCRSEYHDVSVVYPLEEKEKLAKAKKEAAQIALAKARAQRQQKKKNKKKKSLGKLKPKNSRKKKKIRKRTSSKLGNDLGKSSTPKDIAMASQASQCSSFIKTEKDFEDQSTKECAVNSKISESNYFVLCKEEVKIKLDQVEAASNPQVSNSQRTDSHVSNGQCMDPQVSNGQYNSPPNVGNGVPASNQPSLEANLKVSQSSVTSLQVTSNSTGCSDFSCKSPTVVIVSSNLSPKCGSPASTTVVTVPKTSLADHSDRASTDISHVSHTNALAQPVSFNVTNSLPQARFMRLITPNVTPSIRAQQPGLSFGTPSFIGARIPVMITLQPQLSLRPLDEAMNSQKSKNTKSSKSPPRRSLQKKNPKEKTPRKHKEKTGDPKEKSKQNQTLSTNFASQREVLGSSTCDVSTKTDTNSDKTSLQMDTQHCVDVTKICPVSSISVRGGIVTSPTTQTEEGKDASLILGSEDTNSHLSRIPSAMNDLQTSDTCSLFHFSPSKFKGKVPDIVRAHLENFSLGGFDESMDIHVQQLAQTISPSKLGHSTSKFDLLAFLESSNLTIKEASGLSSGKNVGTADAETRLSFSGALSEMSSPVTRQTIVSSDSVQSQSLIATHRNEHNLNSIQVNPVDKSAVSVNTDVEANLSQGQLSVKEECSSQLEVDKRKLKSHEQSCSTSNLVDSSQVDDIEEWTEDWDRSILNVVAVEGMKDAAIRKIQAEIPGKSAKEILSRARLLLQMLQNMGDGDSDTGTEMSCDESSNMG